MFGHFCGGEDLRTIQPTVENLKRSGIGGILDYAAEADVGADVTISTASADSDVPTTTRSNQALAREYSYQTERQCDANVKIFETAIRAVHGVTPDGFAAIKVTALGNPILLERWSTALREIYKLFGRMDVDKDGMVTFEEFTNVWNQLFVGDSMEIIINDMFKRFDKKGKGFIDPIAWTTTLDPPLMRRLAGYCKKQGSFAQAVLTTDEEKLVKSMQSRLRRLVALAADLNVRLMIDAEHTYFQPAIDNLVLSMQREFNKNTDCVYQTIQCYLKDARTRNQLFMDQARIENWQYAVKIVRGAYMHQERDRAKKRGEEDPIHSTIEDTHKCYEEIMEDVISRENVQEGREKVNLVVATHNQSSVECTIRLLEEYGLERMESGVAFGQLLGMSDHLTYSLGQNGYKVYKYIPYGPILECLPYLIRRAQENSDLMGSVGYELGMLAKEIRRRMIG
mmetsp:Transcript_31244/g.52874  ORF Transcript_31244/g.52874 Transcript_31244/m.52874 type:complete len:453 (+) Transcript_31244:575-1933(+)